MFCYLIEQIFIEKLMLPPTHPIDAGLQPIKFWTTHHQTAAKVEKNSISPSLDEHLLKKQTPEKSTKKHCFLLFFGHPHTRRKTSENISLHSLHPHSARQEQPKSFVDFRPPSPVTIIFKKWFALLADFCFQNPEV